MPARQHFSHLTLTPLLIAALTLTLAGCKLAQQAPAPQPQPQPRPQPPPAPTADVDTEDLAAANTAFGLDLLGTLVAAEPDRNVIVSPSSVAFALSMTYNGAAGDTAKAMAEVLRLGGMDSKAVNEMNAALMASLVGAEPEVELSIANSLWAKEGIEFLPDFTAANQSYFGADLFTLDFGDPGTLRKINDWVSEQTRGKIDKIIDRIGPLSILFLINAVYFNGKWEEPFEEEYTKDGPFTLLDGAKVDVPLMSQFGDFPYVETDDYQAVGLWYKGRRVRMVVVLPAEGTTVAELASGLDADAWQKLLADLRGREGSLKLPRYTVEYDTSLKDALSAMGMEVAFQEGQADFSRMATSVQPIWIGDVKHKVFVEVNERGTEAAAATSVEMEMGAAPPPEKPFEMVVDRPFLCAICDTETDTTLFIGVVVDPR